MRKRGRIDQTRLAVLEARYHQTGKAEGTARETIEDALAIFEVALEDHYNLSTFPFRPDLYPFLNFHLTSGKVLAIIDAARLQLIGPQATIAVPDNQEWYVTSTGTLCKFAWPRDVARSQRNAANVSRMEAYLCELNEKDELIIHARSANIARRRTGTIVREMSAEKAFGCMAVALHKLRPFYLSLTHDAGAGIRQEIEDVIRSGRRFAQCLNQSRIRTLDPLGRQAMSAVTAQFVIWCEDMHRLLAKEVKKSARRQMVGELATMFRLLFGIKAKSNVNDPDSPFVRFATTFFAEVGCPCAERTVASELRDWRAANSNSEAGK